jgi:predicted nucleic acid-binding protein
MILIDTSAWIEFLRDTSTPICQAVDDLLVGDIAICDVIAMEILSGACDERHLTQLRGLLARATVLPINPVDYDDAAALYRRCRRKGATIRSLIDCLVAVVAIRADSQLLHADRDFISLAIHTELQTHPASLS